MEKINLKKIFKYVRQVTIPLILIFGCLELANRLARPPRFRYETRANGYTLSAKKPEFPLSVRGFKRERIGDKVTDVFQKSFFLSDRDYKDIGKDGEKPDGLIELIEVNFSKICEPSQKELNKANKYAAKTREKFAKEVKIAEDTEELYASGNHKYTPKVNIRTIP